MYFSAEQSSTAEARPGNGPDTNSRSTVLTAEAVKGLLIIKRDIFVVCAFIKLAES